MTRRVRLGHVAGVEVAVDWSWVFTFALAAWTLFSVADRWLGVRRPIELALLSGAAALGLFASLVAHEVAHALAARACGVPVERLTLFLFGGITDVERDPASPHSEAIAALVAPLTNALVGGAFLALAVVLEARGPATGATPMLDFLVLWLGAVNLAIAVWNLLPAFPLDGGRLVRAAIWRATGDVERATRVAAWCGQLVGWLLVLLGVALALGGVHGLGVVGGLWIALVGWFLASAAAQAYEGVMAQEALAGVNVARLMRRRPASALVEADASTDFARPGDDAARAHALLVERDLERLPVVEDGLIVGIVVRRDIERWIATYTARPAAA
jgi:Zn-dependent protease